VTFHPPSDGNYDLDVPAHVAFVDQQAAVGTSNLRMWAQRLCELIGHNQGEDHVEYRALDAIMAHIKLATRMNPPELLQHLGLAVQTIMQLQHQLDDARGNKSTAADVHLGWTPPASFKARP
jgi:hypothetical protein